MDDLTATNCSRCGLSFEDYDGMTWPAENGGEVCQDCWEIQCSESWWRMMDALYGVAS